MITAPYRPAVMGISIKLPPCRTLIGFRTPVVISLIAFGTPGFDPDSNCAAVFQRKGGTCQGRDSHTIDETGFTWCRRDATERKRFKPILCSPTAILQSIRYVGSIAENFCLPNDC